METELHAPSTDEATTAPETGSRQPILFLSLGGALALVAIAALGWWWAASIDEIAESNKQSPSQNSPPAIKSALEGSAEASLQSILDDPDATLAELSGLHMLNDQSLSQLGRLQELRDVRLANTGTGKLTIQALASVSSIEHLDLSLCDRLDDNALTPLQHMKNLKTLNLRGCTAVTAGTIDHLAHLPSLEELNLSRCPRVSDQALASFLANSPSIRILRVAHTPRNDAGLSLFPSRPGIELIDLRGCPDVTSRGVSLLSEKLPGVRILQ